MFNLKSVVAGLTVLGLTLGLAGGIKPAEAVQLDDGVGKKGSETGQVVDVYLHGLMGDENSLKHMIRYASKYSSFSDSDKQSVSTEYNLPFSGQAGTFVCKGGKVFLDKYSSYKKKKGSTRVYDVIFSNNTDKVENQVAYIDKIVKSLTSKGAKVNLIGHSMGGLSATYYVTHKQKNLTNPTVNKLVTIGSPLNGAPASNFGLAFIALQKRVFNSPITLLASYITDKKSASFSPAFKDLKPNSKVIENLFPDGKKQRVNKKIKVLSIAGSYVIPYTKGKPTTRTDGLVAEDSSMLLQYHVDVEDFEALQYKANHVELMHDKEVASDVNKYLRK